MTRSDRIRALGAVLLLGAAGLLAACDDDAPPPAPAGPGPAAAVAGLDGLYVTGEVVPVPLPDGMIRLVSSMPCARLGGMPKAGQWRAADELRYPEQAADAAALFGSLGLVPALVLQRGDRLAFATLEGGSACTATVSPLRRAEVSLTGDGLPGAVAGWAATTRCYRSGDDLTVAFYFDTDAHVGGIGTVTVAAGGAVVADEVSITLYRHRSTVLAELSRLDWGADAGSVDGAGIRELSGDEQTKGAAAVAGTAERPAGTLSLERLLDADGAQVTVSVPFACAEVGRFG